MLDALTVTQLYKARWQVELFFKWIKQNLRIKAFFGTSPNAVKTQIWIAVCVYVLVAILAKEQAITRSLSDILQIVGIMLFEKVPVNQALAVIHEKTSERANRNQLVLFNF
jgi:nicotinamide riboside transporter PnuC